MVSAMANSYAALAHAVLHQAARDFLTPLPPTQLALTPTQARARERAHLRVQVEAGQFLLERSDAITAHWHTLSGVSQRRTAAAQERAYLKRLRARYRLLKALDPDPAPTLHLAPCQTTRRTTQRRRGGSPSRT